MIGRKILIADTLYPDFLKSIPIDPSGKYETELKKIMARCFGTADVYSNSLSVLGWQTMDVIANCEPLQELWANEAHWYGGDRLEAQIAVFDPDVIFLQDLSLAVNKGDRLLAAQCSCPWPGDEAVRRCDVIFTSFPHYAPRIEALGVKAVYNPLAFDVGVLSRINTDVERIHDVVFIGGVGNPSHWKRGMETLNAVAEAIQTFKWWGYGADLLPDGSLKQKYCGQAFGLDMYEILLQSKICLNRHGEVAEGYANNMRMFEATGCGATLLTEAAPNIGDFFDSAECCIYRSPMEAVFRIQDALRHWTDECCLERSIGLYGQRRTLRDHTYAHRMKTVSDALEAML